MLAAVASSPARDALDWSRVHVWFGDERFLPDGDPERNETQAREALLDHVPLDPAKVHAMPPVGGACGDDVHVAADLYRQELADHAGASAEQGVPMFDVLLLGIGPDAHVASLFPGLPGVRETGTTVVGVEGSPKPPPERVSLTLPALDSATEIWFVACGSDKAEAVARAMQVDADPSDVPASAPRGRAVTRWLLDESAASQLRSRVVGPSPPIEGTTSRQEASMLPRGGGEVHPDAMTGNRYESAPPAPGWHPPLLNGRPMSGESTSWWPDRRPLPSRRSTLLSIAATIILVLAPVVVDLAGGAALRDTWFLSAFALVLLAQAGMDVSSAGPRGPHGRSWSTGPSTSGCPCSWSSRYWP